MGADHVEHIRLELLPHPEARRLWAISRAIEGIPALGRVVLTLDPAVAPKSVANVYRQAQQQPLSEGRVRELSDKHRQLALFALEQSRETSVDEQMAKTNGKVEYEISPDAIQQALVLCERCSRGTRPPSTAAGEVGFCW